MKLVIVDTFQMVRKPSRDSAYAADYADLTPLKRLADANGIAVVVVHHARKMGDADVFNTVSGTTGITGCADSTRARAPSSHCGGWQQTTKAYRTEDGKWNPAALDSRGALTIFPKRDASNSGDSSSESAAMWLRLRCQAPGCPAAGTRVWGGHPNKARVVSRCSGETCSQGSSGFREPLVQLAPLSR